MRSFFRVINSIFFVTALLAVAFCAYQVYSTVNFPKADYEAQISELKSEKEQTQEETLAARRDFENEIAFLREDIRNLGDEGVALAERIEGLEERIGTKAEQAEEKQKQAELFADMPGAVETARREYGLKIRELEEKIQNGGTDVRICYWTLDDGPTYITENFLNALDEMDEHVHVTFFTANEANDSPNEEEMLRREMTGGHSVQNHSYAHSTLASGSVYVSVDSFKEQIMLQDEWLYEVTGFHPTIFRFPGGSAWGRDLLPGAVDAIEELGYEWVDWNCNLYDAGAEENLPSADLEIQRAVTQISEEPIAMILGHDWNRNTLIAMKSAIPTLMEKGYVFLPLFPESVTMGMIATR